MEKRKVKSMLDTHIIVRSRAYWHTRHTILAAPAKIKLDKRAKRLFRELARYFGWKNG